MARNPIFGWPNGKPPQGGIKPIVPTGIPMTGSRMANPFGGQVVGSLPGQAGQQQDPIMAAKQRQLMSQDMAQKDIMLGEQMIARGSDYGPVATWQEGLGRLSQAIAGGIKKGRAEKDERERQDRRTKALEKMKEYYQSGDQKGFMDEYLASGLIDPEDAAGLMAQSMQPEEQWEVTQLPNGAWVQVSPDGQYKELPGMDAGWSEPFRLEDGGLYQQNMDDGQIRKVGGGGGNSFEITGYDDQNRPLISYGPGSGMNQMGGIAVDKQNRQKLMEDTIERQQLINQLDDLYESYEPEFLTYGGKVKDKWLSIKDKANSELTPEEMQFKYNMQQFQLKAWNLTNSYIRKITGAQMSEVEAERLMRAIPNAGKGIFDGDSPTDYLAKMDALIYETKLGYARNVMLMKYGVKADGTAYSADEIMADMNQYHGATDENGKKIKGRQDGSVLGYDAEAVEAFIRDQWQIRKNDAMAQGMDEAQAAQSATQSIEQEFGVTKRRNFQQQGAGSSPVVSTLEEAIGGGSTGAPGTLPPGAPIPVR